MKIINDIKIARCAQGPGSQLMLILETMRNNGDPAPPPPPAMKPSPQIPSVDGAKPGDLVIGGEYRGLPIIYRIS